MLLDLSVPGNYMPSQIVEDKIPAPFYCTGGCGGKLASESSREHWEFGTCIEQDNCL